VFRDEAVGGGAPMPTTPNAKGPGRNRDLTAGDKGFCAFHLGKQMGVKNGGKVIDCFRGSKCDMHHVDLARVTKEDYKSMLARTIPIPAPLQAEFQNRC